MTEMLKALNKIKSGEPADLGGISQDRVANDKRKVMGANDEINFSSSLRPEYKWIELRNGKPKSIECNIRSCRDCNKE